MITAKYGQISPYPLLAGNPTKPDISGRKTLPFDPYLSHDPTACPCMGWGLLRSLSSGSFPKDYG